MNWLAHLLIGEPPLWVGWLSLAVAALALLVLLCAPWRTWARSRSRLTSNHSTAIQRP